MNNAESRIDFIQWVIYRLDFEYEYVQFRNRFETGTLINNNLTQEMERLYLFLRTESTRQATAGVIQTNPMLPYIDTFNVSPLTAIHPQDLVELPRSFINGLE